MMMSILVFQSCTGAVGNSLFVRAIIYSRENKLIARTEETNGNYELELFQFSNIALSISLGCLGAPHIKVARGSHR